MFGNKIMGILMATSILAAVMCSTGCSTTYGHLVPSSQFAYPNSNIKSLGPATAEIQKSAWLVQPRLKMEDIKKCYNDAVSKVANANILINYKEDTTFTEYPFGISTIKYCLRGEAAQMTIGQQEIK